MRKKILLSCIYLCLLLLVVGCENSNRNKIYDDIINEITKQGLINNNLKYITSKSPNDLITTDDYNKYYFYIDNDLYNNYKYYWLEDVNENEYYNGYNSNLDETGEYVLKAINIREMLYENDCTDCYDTKLINNLNLNKNNKYYLVNFYDKAIYVKWITKHENKNNFNIYDWFEIDENSLDEKYIVYKSNNKWKYEKLEEIN